jgi:hypothetical protein
MDPIKYRNDLKDLEIVIEKDNYEIKSKKDDEDKVIDKFGKKNQLEKRNKRDYDNEYKNKNKKS